MDERGVSQQVMQEYPKTNRESLANLQLHKLVIKRIPESHQKRD